MKQPIASRKHQSGAALYVSLIVLILMTLIGVVAMQVAGLQERMSANYQASSIAFQNAERGARRQERLLSTAVTAGNVIATNIAPNFCGAVPDAVNWAGDDPYVRRLDLCFSWAGMDFGQDEANRIDQIYQITSFAKDRTVFSSSQAVVDTVFIP